MIVNVEEVTALLVQLQKINAVPLHEIVWQFGGKTVDVAEGVVEDFRFTGLNNVSFCEYYFLTE